MERPRLQEYWFHFGLNFWHTTLFYCDIKWDTQQKHVDVFDTPAESPLACMENEECFWLVTEDGFFASVDNKNWFTVELAELGGGSPSARLFMDTAVLGWGFFKLRMVVSQK
ncbi:hypothetical protein ACLB2K_035729 [Fragaria x ananassa]